MSANLYSGAIDWDRIYRIFHNTVQIAKRVQEELDDFRRSVIFSGVRDTAAHLAGEIPVTFVDHSLAITGCANNQFSKFHDVQTGDITQLVATLPAPNIVIACRISAYWDSVDYFERLTDALRSFPRELVLIDFFDRDQVFPEEKITFEAENGSGVWDFLEEVNPNSNEPEGCKLKLKVSYTLSDKSFSYEGYRSFFRKGGLLDWLQTQLKDYDVTSVKPLKDQGPSFTPKLTRK